MTLIDITIDTDVLMHAEDKRQSSRQASRDLITEILASDTLLCVDEGFDISESRNRSHIGAEYLEFLRFGSLGLYLVATLASNMRIKQHPKRAGNQRDKVIRLLVIDDRDRKFVAVAYHSESRILYSHDNKSFSDRIRKEIVKQLAVRVLRAGQK